MSIPSVPFVFAPGTRPFGEAGEPSGQSTNGSASDSSEAQAFRFTLPEPTSRDEVIATHETRPTRRRGRVTGKPLPGKRTENSVTMARALRSPVSRATGYGLNGADPAPDYPAAVPEIAKDYEMGSSAQRTLRLTSLNYDVLECIMSFLPAQALAALSETCRYFSELTPPVLCRLPRGVLRSPTDILSFSSFLRLGSTAPRWPFIKELYFYAGDVYSDQFPVVHPGKPHLIEGYDLSDVEVLLQIVHACRNVQRLRIDDWRELANTSILCQTISMLPALIDLRVTFSGDILTRDYRRLTRTRLRTLVLDIRNPFESYPDMPDAVQYLQPLSASLVDLRLPFINRWEVSSDLVFPHVQSLVCGFPGWTPEQVPNTIRQAFPALQHLTLEGHPSWHDCWSDMGLTTLESLRQHHQRLWGSRPDVWPALVSLTCRHSCELYSLAIPRHIPYLAVWFSYKDRGGGLGRTMALVEDVYPSCLELHIDLATHNFHAHRPMFSLDTDSTCLEFKVLKAPARPLRRCVLIIDHVLNSTQYYLDGVRALNEALGEVLRHLSLTHLLIQFRISWEEQYKHWRLPTNTEDANCESLSMMEIVSLEVASFFEASSTLTWVGVWEERAPLKSWTVRRTPQPESDGRLEEPSSMDVRELDEASGWKVMDAEDMRVVERYHQPPA
ncbi:hypothetical protein C8Q77DRAFT_500585 [Trametes polyzona]|nr:hypothetical protein C8Q77DRAFT_500585 [Trametes polyzona]